VRVDEILESLERGLQMFVEIDERILVSEVEDALHRITDNSRGNHFHDRHDHLILTDCAVLILIDNTPSKLLLR